MEGQEQREVEPVEVSEVSLGMETSPEIPRRDMATWEEDLGKNMSFLAGVLQLPIETFQSLAANEEGKSVLQKVCKCLGDKNSEVEDCESSLKVATENRDQLLSKWFVLLYRNK